ncbi:hypothetical protein Ciccas_005803 [Cichlidogyrus casuarinus]|uniref:Uncharacterized protein n=1 Tax=Cichlidogyrus casuarinus TaxID=1844966 RepID=A0ABD2Q7L4_9PLAT
MPEPVSGHKKKRRYYTYGKPTIVKWYKDVEGEDALSEVMEEMGLEKEVPYSQNKGKLWELEETLTRAKKDVKGDYITISIDPYKYKQCQPKFNSKAESKTVSLNAYMMERLRRFQQQSNTHLYIKQKTNTEISLLKDSWGAPLPAEKQLAAKCSTAIIEGKQCFRLGCNCRCCRVNIPSRQKKNDNIMRGIDGDLDLEEDVVFSDETPTPTPSRIMGTRPLEINVQLAMQPDKRKPKIKPCVLSPAYSTLDIMTLDSEDESFTSAGCVSDTELLDEWVLM